MVVIDVRVRLRGHLADRYEDGSVEVALPDAASVRALRDALDLPPGPYVWVVNGSARTDGASLTDGDRVEVHPPAAGG